MNSVSQADLQALLNVTADSLAEYCGLTGDRQENALVLERQVHISILNQQLSSHLYPSLLYSKGIHHTLRSIRAFQSTLTLTVHHNLLLSVNLLPNISLPS